jgi:hypothetical protein
MKKIKHNLTRGVLQLVEYKVEHKKWYIYRIFIRYNYTKL